MLYDRAVAHVGVKALATRRCEVPDCWREMRRYGVCDMHSQRIRKHGEDVIDERSGTTPLPEVALMLNRHMTTSGCWVRPGQTHPGYGGTELRRRKIALHRFACQLFNGPIPEGYVVDHLCGNPPCFNPEHLEAVTQSTNLRRSPLLGAKTHCVDGHEFTEGNTYVTNAGARQCRTCHRERETRRRAGR